MNRKILTRTSALVALFTMSILLGYSAFAENATLDTSFLLNSEKASYAKGEVITLDLVMKNPSLKQILSFQTKINYDTSVLTGKSIEFDKEVETLFDYNINSDQPFSETDKTVNIGRAIVSSSTSYTPKAEYNIAKISFELKADATASQLEFSFKPDTSDTGIYITSEGVPVNTVKVDELKPISVSIGTSSPTEPVVPVSDTGTSTPVTTPVEEVVAPDVSTTTPVMEEPAVVVENTDNLHPAAETPTETGVTNTTPVVDNVVDTSGFKTEEELNKANETATKVEAPVYQEVTAENNAIGGSPEMVTYSSENTGAEAALTNAPTTPKNGPEDLLYLIFASIFGAYILSKINKKLNGIKL